MALIRATFTTMGQSSPASVGEDAGAGHYKYKKDPEWVPGASRYKEPGQGESLPQNAKATTAKQKRMAEYNRLRLKKVPKEEAAQQIGISESAMHFYEREFAAQHPQEPKP